MDRISLTFFSSISNGQHVLGNPMDLLQKVQCYTTNVSCSSHFYFDYIIFSFYDIHIPVIGVYELDLRINFGYGIGHFSCGICICLWFANMFVKKNAMNGRQILHRFSIDRVDT